MSEGIDEATTTIRQCGKCQLLGCSRGPGFADIANDPPSRWRCPCECHPVNQVLHAPDCTCLRHGERRKR